MPLTISKVGQDDVGLTEFVAADIVFGDSYPTGGEPLTAAEIGFRVGSLLLAVDITLDGLIVQYLPDPDNPSRGNLKVFEEQGASGKLAEIGNGTDLSAESGRAICFGR